MEVRLAGAHALYDDYLDVRFLRHELAGDGNGSVSAAIEIEVEGFHAVLPYARFRDEDMARFAADLAQFVDDRSGAVALTAEQPGECELLFEMVDHAARVLLTATFTRSRQACLRFWDDAITLHMEVDPASLAALLRDMRAFLNDI